MMTAMVFMKFEYGEMSKYEKALEIMNDDTEEDEAAKDSKGKVIDLILPVAVLIVLCVLGLVYSGGIFDSESESYGRFMIAFSNADASVGLLLGSFGGLIITVIFYLCRKVLSFKSAMECVPDGFKAMVNATEDTFAPALNTVFIRTGLFHGKNA